jgi:Putative zinc-finger
MECDEVLLRLWEYLDQELGPPEAAAVQNHLSRCSGCYSACRCNGAFLDLLARQRTTCPAHLVISVRTRLRPS